MEKILHFLSDLSCHPKLKGADYVIYSMVQGF